MRTPNPRPGFTLLELTVVLAIIILLSAIAIPSLSGIRGNTDQKGAADTVRARIADARGRAMEFGVTYRLAVSQDGTKLRLAPDADDFASVAVDNPPFGASRASEDTLEKVTVTVAGDPEAGTGPHSPDGWTTIATFLPDGTCREDRVLVEVNETGFPPIEIRIRGVTGDARVNHPQTANGGMMP